jgi:two-component system OmpR family response regulator
MSTLTLPTLTVPMSTPPALAHRRTGDELTVTVRLTLAGNGAPDAAERLVAALHAASVPTAVIDSGWPDPAPANPAAAELVLDRRRRSAQLNGDPVRFTRREYDLIFFLAEHPGTVFTRRQLLRAVWGHEFSGERTVDVHIRRIRVKLGDHGPAIVTIHGFGYRLDEQHRVALV